MHNLLLFLRRQEFSVFPMDFGFLDTPFRGTDIRGHSP